ncbi:MAG: NAD-dependent epimerase/dehydratase [Arthrobacter sp.]|nr:NAD-dependent epimerase/dehydratase [Arthrobacter sp.]
MTAEKSPLVLIVGATGGIGRLAVEAAVRHGLQVRALARDRESARKTVSGVEIVQGDLEDPATLGAAVKDIDAIVFTHGANGVRASYQDVDYGGVANILSALNGRRPRTALMTSINVTRSQGAYKELLDWKRRSERLVRLSGVPYTIVRPSWFDSSAGEHLVLGQGDTASGAVRREHVAEVLIQSLLTDAALGKTFELYAASGAPTADWEGLFGSVVSDAAGALDGVKDPQNLPLNKEPAPVREDLARLLAG